MKIKQVEELIGITSRNIRFYEDQGLLKPERADNGYREYHEKEAETLKKIKLLRKMDIPVEEIKAVLDEQTSLCECLEQHIDLLESERDKLANMQQLAAGMMKAGCTIGNLNTDDWLDQMENMEKEGIDFVDLSKVDVRMKKKLGAVAGGGVVFVWMLFILSVLLWMNRTDSMPVGLLIFFIVAAVGVMAGVIAALRSRLQEIEGGEEDEAAKY